MCALFSACERGKMAGGGHLPIVCVGKDATHTPAISSLRIPISTFIILVLTFSTPFEKCNIHYYFQQPGDSGSNKEETVFPLLHKLMHAWGRPDNTEAHFNFVSSSVQTVQHKIDTI